MSAALPIVERLRARESAVTQVLRDGVRQHGRLVNPDGPEAAALIEELYEALEVIGNGCVDVSDTAIIVGNGAKTVFAQVRAALARAGEQ